MLYVNLIHYLYVLNKIQVFNVSNVYLYGKVFHQFTLSFFFSNIFQTVIELSSISVDSPSKFFKVKTDSIKLVFYPKMKIQLSLMKLIPLLKDCSLKVKKIVRIENALE